MKPDIDEKNSPPPMNHLQWKTQHQLQSRMVVRMSQAEFGESDDQDDNDGQDGYDDQDD